MGPLDGGGGGSGARLGQLAVTLAGICAIVATVVSCFSIWLQLKNYRKPLLQRYVIRILLMVPIYAISSWVSLLSFNAGFFLDPIRDIYEAFTIYTFFQLLINFLGGERSAIIMTHGRAPKPHLWPMDIVLPKVDISDPYTFLNIKRGILQYAWLKPVLAIATIAMKIGGVYQEGYVGLQSGYFWSGIVYNLSVSLSLYSLGMFWACMHNDLQPFRPVPKFLCIKLIIFASYWQGFFLSILVWLGIIKDVGHYTPDNLARAIQDCLICIELPAFAVAHWYAFSWKDYADATISSARMPVRFALRDAYGIRDLIEDTKLTFGGEGYDYRGFDSAGETTMVHAESAGRMARIMDGMRYERGGKGKYWIPKPAANSRAALLGGASSAAGRTDPEARRAVEGNTRWYGSTDAEDVTIDMDDDDERLYTNARAMEFGDYNYPVVTAHIPYEDRRWNMPREEEGLITTATNQALLRPELVTRPARKKNSKSSKGKKKAPEQGTTEETQGLIKKVPDLLERMNSTRSSSSHTSQRSGIVDLVVEDKEAEEVEKVRARKEGGPAWNQVEPKRFVRQYPPERAGEETRTGFDPSEDPEVENAKKDDADPTLARDDGAFVVAEDDDNNDNDDESDSERPKNLHKYGSMAEDHNPWGEGAI